MQIEKKAPEAKVEMQMTPMIDVVFQLLTFFLMSFKIATAEGDFDIKMPLAARGAVLPDDLKTPPIKVRLAADPSGKLAQIKVNEFNFGLSFGSLHDHVLRIAGDDVGPDSRREEVEVELDCDYNLHYEYVIEAVTAVSGHVGADGNIVRLIEKVKFSPPRAKAG
jgi:biopolymer transport protein ExbD